MVVPTNLVTAWHTITTDLRLPLPWPKKDDYRPSNDPTILIWGGSSSVGQYTVQLLAYYGYSKVVAVASASQHDFLTSLGAAQTFDYNDPTILAQLQNLGAVPVILDCIGSKPNSLATISQVATKDTKIAIMLPVIIRDASETEKPIYEMDITKVANWAPGTLPIGVRTHFYQQNEFNAENLQRVIIPELLEKRIVRPNKIRIVEGKSMLDRAERCLELLRGKKVRGEKLVWRLDYEDLGL